MSYTGHKRKESYEVLTLTYLTGQAADQTTRKQAHPAENP